MVLIVSALPLSVIPGIPVNIPTFLHHYSVSPLSRELPRGSAGFQRVSAGLQQQEQSVWMLGFSGVWMRTDGDKSEL